LQTKGTYPKFATDIDLTRQNKKRDNGVREGQRDLPCIMVLPVRIQDGTTGSFASDRLVVDWVLSKVFTFFQRSVETGNGNHRFGRFDTGRRPGIPGETDTVLLKPVFSKAVTMRACESVVPVLLFRQSSWQVE
jgi:hypothetical protein